MNSESKRSTVWRWRVLEKDENGRNVWRELPGRMTIPQAREWVKRHGRHLSQIEGSDEELEPNGQ
jgi:hypothetical protein